MNIRHIRESSNGKPVNVRLFNESQIITFLLDKIKLLGIENEEFRNYSKALAFITLAALLDDLKLDARHCRAQTKKGPGSELVFGKKILFLIALRGALPFFEAAIQLLGLTLEDFLFIDVKRVENENKILVPKIISVSSYGPFDPNALVIGADPMAATFMSLNKSVGHIKDCGGPGLENSVFMSWFSAWEAFETAFELCPLARYYTASVNREPLNFLKYIVRCREIPVMPVSHIPDYYTNP